MEREEHNAYFTAGLSGTLAVGRVCSFRAGAEYCVELFADSFAADRRRCGHVPQHLAALLAKIIPLADRYFPKEKG